MQKCMPVAYKVHGVGELIGFIGLLTLLGTIGYMIYLRNFGDFHASAWWYLAIPFGIGIVSEIMVQLSWHMVSKTGFKYDYKNRESSWVNGSERIHFKYGQQNDVT